MNPELPARRVKRMLKDLSRQLYFAEGGGWTADTNQAHDFSEVQELIAMCDVYDIRDAEVVELAAPEQPEPPETSLSLKLRVA